jgi:hypothetical protein
MSPKLAEDPQVHSGGVRASDKGFLNLPWREYLALLRWTSKQRSKEGLTEVPAKLQVDPSEGLGSKLRCGVTWCGISSVTSAEPPVLAAPSRWPPTPPAPASNLIAANERAWARARSSEAENVVANPLFKCGVRWAYAPIFWKTPVAQGPSVAN